jgi:hypothetical protein
MRVSLAKAPSNGETEPELTISCNQARHVEGLGHQQGNNIFDLQFVLPTKGEEIKVAQKFWE